MTSGNGRGASTIDVFFVPADDTGTPADERAQIEHRITVTPAGAADQPLGRVLMHPTQAVAYIAAGTAGVLVVDARRCFAQP